jgi:hypothetical protein
MNIRLFSIAILVSAIPLFALADSVGIALNKGDFLSAERVVRDGGVLVSVKLSKSGKAKFKKLNETSVNQPVHAEIAGVASDFRIREPIQGDTMEMGPYTQDEARKVISEINRE